MKTRDCCLTLMLPKMLEETIIGHLLEHPEWISGFNAGDVSGHGEAGVAHSAGELVRGASQRVRIQTVVNCEDATALIAYLRARVANPEVAYWLTPVLEFGRFE
ncbi:MAG TPA: DUF3240 family protein [Burkholderiales bacterium]|nr:DUF3240 family protein [Burkholderiales bacterium]